MVFLRFVFTLVVFIPRFKILNPPDSKVHLGVYRPDRINQMEEKQDNEKMIGKLIKKRKQENNAFFKLLNALETKTIYEEQPKTPKKPKS